MPKCLGALKPDEWESFDRHAAYVQEIVYEDISVDVHIEPSVYVRLALRRSRLLPNVVRFACPSSAQPSASEVLLYLQSSLQVLELGSSIGYSGGAMAMTRNTVISSLSATPCISNIILVSQPVSFLSECIPLENITSLELRDMSGFLDATLLCRIGSLPHLRSFSANSACFARLNRVEEIAHASLFMKLEYLRLDGGVANSTALSFLDNFPKLIGSKNLRYLTFEVGLADRRGSRDGRGRGIAVGGIITRWSQTLCHLNLQIDHSQTAINDLLRRLPALRTLNLSGHLYITDEKDISSTFAGLAELQTLSFRCRFGSASKLYIQFDVRSITRLVEHCPKLRELNVAISTSPLPPFSSTPTLSHNLREITINYSTLASDVGDTLTNAVTLARHLDRLFPLLDTVRYDDPAVGGGSQNETAWRQVQELILVFQDVRRNP